MKYGDTFVASGYKYGLLKYPGKNLPSIPDAIEQCVGKDDSKQSKEQKKDMEIVEAIIPKTAVPFEDVDGMTLEELAGYSQLQYSDRRNWSFNRYLVFVMYDSISGSEISETSSNRIESEELEEEGKLRYLYVIDPKKNKEATIDEVVEEQLTKNIGRMKVKNRRRALGFLEKYVYGDKISTIRAINNYLGSKYESVGSNFKEYVRLPKRLSDRENNNKN